ncbi:hypothetical protein L1987_01001 [Smallanthus sonchifolius]|uniref:Uncharacterized protein n=1 Tax=Smallanthus sonchifolius TaxID=185202 RepID=A0ACB9K3V0_9ASTR|nr:hypothetical protein L1987_01001 [Smallanthus sonchifolius]
MCSMELPFRGSIPATFRGSIQENLVARSSATFRGSIQEKSQIDGRNWGDIKLSGGFRLVFAGKNSSGSRVSENELTGSGSGIYGFLDSSASGRRGFVCYLRIHRL